MGKKAKEITHRNEADVHRECGEVNSGARQGGTAEKQIKRDVSRSKRGP